MGVGVLTPCPHFRPGKNKRVGKQLASQKILQLLHPHVKNWGSLLRMYGRESSKMVKQVMGGRVGRRASAHRYCPRHQHSMPLNSPCVSSVLAKMLRFHNTVKFLCI